MAVALADLGAIAFRRTFGAVELDQWDELLECIALHSPPWSPTRCLGISSQVADSRLDPFTGDCPYPWPGGAIGSLGDQTTLKDPHISLAMGPGPPPFRHRGP